MSFPNKEVVDEIRKKFPAGIKVELVSMDDPFSKLQPGDKGIVKGVDDTGTVFVRWDNGEGLGVVYGQDEVKIIKSPKKVLTEEEKAKFIQNRPELHEQLSELQADFEDLSDEDLISLRGEILKRVNECLVLILETDEDKAKIIKSPKRILTEEEKAKFILNRPTLHEQLSEMQADLENLSDEDLISLRGKILKKVNECLILILETDEDNIE